jgi:hypothetical protein
LLKHSEVSRLFSALEWVEKSWDRFLYFFRGRKAGLSRRRTWIVALRPAGRGSVRCWPLPPTWYGMEAGWFATAFTQFEDSNSIWSYRKVSKNRIIIRKLMVIQSSHGNAKPAYFRSRAENMGKCVQAGIDVMD